MINYPNKIYVTFIKDECLKVHSDKKMAHAYAEGRFGTKIDGICVDDVAIVSYTLTVPND